MRSLTLSIVTLLVLAAPRAEASPAAPQLWMYDIHSRTEVRRDLFAYNGVLDWNGWSQMNDFFRSWRTREAHPVAPRLLELLVRTQAQFGGRRIELVSGFRSPGPRDTLSQSQHFDGNAADIRIPGVANRELFEFCRTLPDVGCGLYPHGMHVHVDVRPRSAIWVDLSGYGDGAQYVAHPDEWLANHEDAADEVAEATAPTRHGRRPHRRR